MKVASIQMSVVEGDKSATIDKAVENINRCKGIDLVILPEIWNQHSRNANRPTAVPGMGRSKGLAAWLSISVK